MLYASGHFRVLFSKRDRADVVIESSGRTRATSAISPAFYVVSKLIRCARRDNEYFLRTANIKRNITRIFAILIIYRTLVDLTESHGKKRRTRKDEILTSRGRSKTKGKLEAPPKDKPSLLFSIFIRNIIIRFGLN